MKEVLFCLVVFIIIYLIYFVSVIRKQKKLDKLMTGMEVTYLKKRYSLSLKKLNKKKVGNIIALTNSFIVSVTVFLVSIIDNYILKLMVAFIILVPLIIMSYHLVGLYLKRSEKDV